MTEIKNPFSNLKNSTNKFKDWYSLDFIKILGDELHSVQKDFPKKDFITKYKKSHAELEVKERLKFIALLLKELTPVKSYKEQIKVFNKILGPEWPYDTGMINYGFYLYPFSQYVEIYGPQEKDLTFTLNFIKELTKRFTGEFAIRPLADLHEKEVLKTFKEWTKDKNFHVRRLSSEGLRPRLPWGQSIEWIKKDPKKLFPIFNTLKNDESLYVRRSVANSLGDIIKLDEDLALNLIDSWLAKKPSPEVLWIIKHSIRHPRKKGHKAFVDLNKKLTTLS